MQLPEDIEQLEELELSWVKALTLGAIPALGIPRLGPALADKPAWRPVQERSGVRVLGERHERSPQRLGLRSVEVAAYDSQRGGCFQEAPVQRFERPPVAPPGADAGRSVKDVQLDASVRRVHAR